LLNPKSLAYKINNYDTINHSKTNSPLNHRD